MAAPITSLIKNIINQQAMMNMILVGDSITEGYCALKNDSEPNNPDIESTENYSDINPHAIYTHAYEQTSSGSSIDWSKTYANLLDQTIASNLPNTYGSNSGHFNIYNQLFDSTQGLSVFTQAGQSIQPATMNTQEAIYGMPSIGGGGVTDTQLYLQKGSYFTLTGVETQVIFIHFMPLHYAGLSLPPNNTVSIKHNGQTIIPNSTPVFAQTNCLAINLPEVIPATDTLTVTFNDSIVITSIKRLTLSCTNSGIANYRAARAGYTYQHFLSGYRPEALGALGAQHYHNPNYRGALYIFSLGTNDIFYRQTEQQLITSINSMITRIQSQFNDPQQAYFLIGKPPTIYSGYITHFHLNPQACTAAVDAVAEQNTSNVSVVDFSPVGVPGTLWQDGIHPNLQGHQKMASILCTALGLSQT